VVGGLEVGGGGTDMVGVVLVVAGGIEVEVEVTVPHSLLPQDCPGLQALHSVPKVQTMLGKSQQTASDV
jgi:hypothetical protein